MEPTERIQPRQLRRATPSGVTTSYGLPFDVLKTAIRRLGFLGLVIGLMAPSAYLLELLIQPERVVLPAGKFPFPAAVAGFLFVAGAAVCFLAWSGKLPAQRVLDLGLVFQVVVTFAISLSENATPWPPDHPIRGISWNCLWIAMYVVAIPGTYGKSVLAAFAAAAMAPFGLLVATAVNQNPIPAPKQLLLLLLPPFAAAGWAIPVGRYLYRLGTQVSKARAMGSYELLELIGRGGMGEVWRAKHRMLARVAAIKLIRAEMLGVENLESAQLQLRRFEREARATAGLRSPHTVVLYDYGVSEDGSFYYVMELLEGMDLGTLVSQHGPQPPGRVMWLLRQAAKSLAEAHEHGLVHRDVKPRNIFCCRVGSDDDFVKVLDFGLVKIRAGEETQTQLTRAGLTGTPAYMAPEIAMNSAEVDGRADLYSLGCVGYWLLTGCLVFEGASTMAMVLAHVQTPPPPPSQRTEVEVPASLERVILKCLEKDPARRPQTAWELIALLDGCRDVEPWTQERAETWWAGAETKWSGAVS
jgi:tRNA A-37 threonylcarbamoyl transferase component Bud32